MIPTGGSPRICPGLQNAESIIYSHGAEYVQTGSNVDGVLIIVRAGLRPKGRGDKLSRQKGFHTVHIVEVAIDDLIKFLLGAFKTF